MKHNFAKKIKSKFLLKKFFYDKQITFTITDTIKQLCLTI